MVMHMAVPSGAPAGRFASLGARAGDAGPAAASRLCATMAGRLAAIRLSPSAVASAASWADAGASADSLGALLRGRPAGGRPCEHAAGGDGCGKSCCAAADLWPAGLSQAAGMSGLGRLPGVMLSARRVERVSASALPGELSDGSVSRGTPMRPRAPGVGDPWPSRSGEGVAEDWKLASDLPPRGEGLPAENGESAGGPDGASASTTTRRDP